ncbi:MAG: TetR/AcrR family transcriptional regulator [Sphingomonadaceae bacterium]|nr:TetR/AcrR family transcriptional regulator [Sphingomonadaceae bacterium]
MTTSQKPAETKAQAARGPGRPSAKRAAAIDHLVIETANRHFREQGYDAVSLERIAADAGISKGTLYARHASKEALFLAVWREAVGRWSARAAAQDHLLTADLRQTLAHHAATIVDSLRDPEVLDFQLMILANASRFPEIAREIQAIGHEYIAGVVAQDIADAALREALPVRDAASVANLFVSAITGWLLQRGAGEAPSREEALAHAMRAVDLVMAARAAW